MKHKKPAVPYTVERCGSCGRDEKRLFREGDVVFAAAGSCTCGGKMTIEMIFGEAQG
ncbi:hypothetical protein CENSYa_1232 [Cenarchaeum symbiosum A]|uniref:Uncharacterized protein n=1 Tax=Cenarchaeum symbiosum (strain A) TaxID=414004 RepID=A0RWY8_CENSY|nr:hypothetical protein CENSYa_1232 [Cenarchaeum symbiosum A]